jgi:hypothetical protein
LVLGGKVAGPGGGWAEEEKVRLLLVRKERIMLQLVMVDVMALQELRIMVAGLGRVCLVWGRGVKSEASLLGGE